MHTTTQLEIQIRDIAEARRFYTQELGCTEQMMDADHWLFTLGANRILCRLDPALGPHGSVARQYQFTPGSIAPTPHCAMTLSAAEWAALTAHLRRRGVKYTNDGKSCSLVDPSRNVITFSLKQESLSRWRWWRRPQISCLAGLLAGLLWLSWLTLIRS
jgi:extradiol dioxygenase family protein